MRAATGAAVLARRLVPIVLCVVAPVAVAACTHPGHGPGRTTTTSTPGADGPPPIVVRAPGGASLELRAFTYCWVRLCVDGRPPANPPSIGRASEVTVEFPTRGFTFSATFTPAGQPLGSGTPVELSRTGPTTYRLVPPVPAGTYDVLLFGAGEGDVAAAFRWTVVAT